VGFHTAQIASSEAKVPNKETILNLLRIKANSADTEFQGQVGRGSEHRGLVEDVPARCRGAALDGL